MKHLMRTLSTAVLLGPLGGCARTTAPEPTTGITVLLTPSSGSIAECTGVQLAIDVRNQTGYPIAPDSVRWSSSDSTAATVSSGGLIRALHSSPGITIRVVVYRTQLQASAQAVFAIVRVSALCPP